MLAIQSERNRRKATTILEVLFATVVIVIGLLGIASLIPFAARDAQQANNHNQAISLGLGWADSFFARGLHIPSVTSSEEQFKWVWFRDYGTDATRWEFFSREGYADSSAAALRVNGSAVGIQSPSFSVAAGGSAARRIWAHVPVCIDPFFLSANSTAQRLNSERANNDSSSRVAWYRSSVFPYFQDRYDPALDPFSTSTAGFTVDQPRMLRVGLGFFSTAAPYPHSQPVSNSLAANLFGSMDDLEESTYFDPDAIESTDPRVGRQDFKEFPAERLFTQLDTNGNSIPDTPLKSMLTKRYTWKATIVPTEPIPSEVATATLAASYAGTPARSALASFLILHKHSSEYIPLGSAPSPGSTEDKPTGERLVRVYPLSGNFVGGAGGRVRLVGNGSTNSDVEVGDWIMLGRYYLQDPATRLYPFFRWYRIISVDSGASEGELQNLRPTYSTPSVDQYGATNETELAWARDVVLDGPDFAFGEYPPVPLPSLPYAWWPSVTTPTEGTLVSGVVTVVERQVQLD